MALSAALMLVLLVSLPVLSAGAAGDPGEDGSESAILIRMPASAVAHVGLTIPASALGLLLLAAILIPEFLSSHFGEKRPDAGGEGSLSVALFAMILTTALHPVPSHVFHAAPEKWRYQP